VVASPAVRRARTRAPAVAAVALAAVLAACSAPARPGAARPAPSPAVTAVPAPGATATAPAAATPVPTIPAVEEIATEVAALRRLDTGGPVAARVVSDAELGEILVRLEEEAAAEEGVLPDADAERVLAALRLLPPDADLGELRETILRQGVAGVYVPAEDVLYVASSAADLTASSEVTAAHEVLHALQDRAFDLERPGDALLDTDSDAALAFTSVVEGDAIAIQEAWSQAHQSAEEQQGRRTEEQAQVGDATALFTELPPYLLDSLSFPYSEGARFVATLRESGGDAAVDAALRDPPRTTAEIVVPQRHLDGFTPVELPVPPAPPGWEELDTDTFGVFDLAWVATPADGPARVQGVLAARAELARSWQGGRVGAWTRGEDVAIGAAVRMGSAQDGASLCADVRAWYEVQAAGVPAGGDQATTVLTGDRDVLALACDGADVRLGLAPDAATATGLAAVAG